MFSFLEPIRKAPIKGTISIYGSFFLVFIYLYYGKFTVFYELAPHIKTSTIYYEWFAHGYQFMAIFILMFIIPLLWVVFGERRSLSEIGIAIGDWRFGLKAVLVAMLIITIPLYINAGTPAFQEEYPLAKIAGTSVLTFILWELCYLLYYIAWEFFFRGFWQLGFKKYLGIYAIIALQTAVSTFLHIGKPDAETASAIIAGVVFGLIALRTRSFIYVLLIHWYVGMATDLFCILRS